MDQDEVARSFSALGNATRLPVCLAYLAFALIGSTTAGLLFGLFA